MTDRHVRLILLDELGTGTVDEVVRQVARVLEVKTSLATNLHCEGGFDPTRRQWRAETMLERCVRPYVSPD